MQARLPRATGDPGVMTVVLPGRSEYTIVATGPDGATARQAVRAAAEARGAHVLASFVFSGANPGAFRRESSGAGGGAVWLRGDTDPAGRETAVQAFALSGATPRPVLRDGRVLGAVYEDEQARYCRLSGVLPRDPGAPRDVQTRDVLESLESLLGEHGFRFTDTVRTWFYLDRLLEWYAVFNTVRTAFFEGSGVFEKRVPASTGIGAANGAAAALTADLLAVQPWNPAARIEVVPSPLQGSALNYRSSFSRAVELGFPTHRSLMISGTASISQDGRTVHLGDVAGQVRRTLDVVEALLRSRGMDWPDVTRAIAYFTDLADRPVFEAICRERGLPPLPLIPVQAAICRSDLLFELEVDAVGLS